MYVLFYEIKNRRHWGRIAVCDLTRRLEQIIAELKACRWHGVFHDDEYDEALSTIFG